MSDKTANTEMTSQEVPMDDLDGVSGGIIIMLDYHAKLLQDDWTTPETAKATQRPASGRS